LAAHSPYTTLFRSTRIRRSDLDGVGLRDLPADIPERRELRQHDASEAHERRTHDVTSHTGRRAGVRLRLGAAERAVRPQRLGRHVCMGGPGARHHCDGPDADAAWAESDREVQADGRVGGGGRGAGCDAARGWPRKRAEPALARYDESWPPRGFNAYCE